LPDRGIPLAQLSLAANMTAGGLPMLWTIVVVLLILWLLGFTMHVAGGVIHVLLVIALVVVVLRLLSGRRVV
jgi:hypothetical protein